MIFSTCTWIILPTYLQAQTTQVSISTWLMSLVIKIKKAKLTIHVS